MLSKKCVPCAAAIAGVLGLARPASALPPADDFLNPQELGPRLSMLAFIGPGLRMNYDHRYELEKSISELRTQVIGDVNVAFSEASANVDVRLFLLSFGASAGYQYNWHLIQFEPGADGRDTAGQKEPVPSKRRFSNLHREARRYKELAGDYGVDTIHYFEGRAGFIWPAEGFIAVNTNAVRFEDRPDTSFSFELGTPYNGGFHFRSETYALFRSQRHGFVGPALRILNVPRSTDQSRIDPPADGEACRNSPTCEEERAWEVHYGFLAGYRPSWTVATDLILARVYTMYGLDNDLFGTHAFFQPIQILFGYQTEFAF